jgi:hypothetical protein
MKQLRPAVALSMILLAVGENAKTKERIISLALQYGRGVHLSRHEVEWVLGHTVFSVVKEEFELRKVKKP